MGRRGDAMTYPRSALVLAIALGLAGVASAPNAQVLTTQDDIGGVYEGTFRGGLQHGTGSYRLPNGYEYTGDWVDGEIKGQTRIASGGRGGGRRPPTQSQSIEARCCTSDGTCRSVDRDRIQSARSAGPGWWSTWSHCIV